MFTAEYSFKNYFHFEVSAELPEEGILKGNQGELRFKRIHDGYAVYDSTLLTSGFIYIPNPDEIFVPKTINDIPVTELHQTIRLKPSSFLDIEHGNLSRVFINFDKNFSEDKKLSIKDPFLRDFAYAFIVDRDIKEMENRPAEVGIRFFGPQVDFCSITCDDKVILHVPRAKIVEVHINKTVLRGSIPNCIERMIFSGKAYPFIEMVWDDDEPNNRCFEGLTNLKLIEGSLSGDICWSLKNCTSLESVHLSNGVEKIIAHAFSNCSSLRNIYVPDTVTEIEEYAFSGCSNLDSIHLPSNLKKIAKGVFKDCKSLKKVWLPDSIESIEDSAFAGCDSL